MLIYVAHKFGGNAHNVRRAKQVTHELQLADLDNCYITPLLCFGHLEYDELGQDEEMALCLELLGKCDKMIVASRASRGVQMEIDYCRTWGIPVEYWRG